MPAPNGCRLPCTTDFKLVEWPIYGSAAAGRIASVKPLDGISRPAVMGASVALPDTLFTRIIGEKYYELKDHLGNVRVVVTDEKMPDLQSGEHPYTANMTSYNNYYPYGMLQPARSWQAGDWRWGFNGKEMDNEVAVTGGSYDYGARMYDARVGRWWSVDPMAHLAPHVAGYVAYAANPVIFVDPDGARVTVTIDPTDPTKTIIRVTGKILNLSSQSIPSNLAEEIRAGAATFNGEYEMLADGARSVTFQFDFEVVTDVRAILPDDNVLVVADFTPPAVQKAALLKQLGQEGMANGITTSDGWLSYINPNSTSGIDRTSVHELFHQIYQALRADCLHSESSAPGTVLARSQDWSMTPEARAAILNAAQLTAGEHMRLAPTKQAYALQEIPGTPSDPPRWAPRHRGGDSRETGLDEGKRDLWYDVVDVNGMVERAIAPQLENAPVNGGKK